MAILYVKNKKPSSIKCLPKKSEESNFKEFFVNQIICGSAVDVMKDIPDGSVDLIITSPPYNLKNSTGNGMKNGSKGKWANAALQNGYSHHDDCMPHDEYVKWQRDCLNEMMRIIPEDGAIFIITNGAYRAAYCKTAKIL